MVELCYLQVLDVLQLHYFFWVALVVMADYSHMQAYDPFMRERCQRRYLDLLTQVDCVVIASESKAIFTKDGTCRLKSELLFKHKKFNKYFTIGGY